MRGDLKDVPWSLDDSQKRLDLRQDEALFHVGIAKEATSDNVRCRVLTIAVKSLCKDSLKTRDDSWN